jgi:hypothetical protein
VGSTGAHQKEEVRAGAYAPVLEGTMDMASNWWILSIRYDILTKAQVAVCIAFLLAMAIVRRKIR